MIKGAARVVVTGLALMGLGVGFIESAIDELFGEANNEIILAIYAIGSGTERRTCPRYTGHTCYQSSRRTVKECCQRASAADWAIPPFQDI